MASPASENTAQTSEFTDVVQALLNEDQLFSLQDRRTNARQNFVRPARIACTTNPNELLSGFTRDLSGTGVGLIHKFDVEVGEHALIRINRLWDEPVVLECKVVWCTKSENDWFQSGWEIVSIAASKESF